MTTCPDVGGKDLNHAPASGSIRRIRIPIGSLGRTLQDDFAALGMTSLKVEPFDA